jgi:hypothetical protein
MYAYGAGDMAPATINRNGFISLSAGWLECAADSPLEHFVCIAADGNTRDDPAAMRHKPTVSSPWACMNPKHFHAWMQSSVEAFLAYSAPLSREMAIARIGCELTCATYSCKEKLAAYMADPAHNPAVLIDQASKAAQDAMLMECEPVCPFEDTDSDSEQDSFEMYTE